MEHGRRGGRHPRATPSVHQLILLESCQLRGLRKRKGLKCLNFALEFRNQIRDETIEQERRSEADDTIGQSFELSKVLRNYTLLLELKKGPLGIIVKRRSESRF